MKFYNWLGLSDKAQHYHHNCLVAKPACSALHGHWLHHPEILLCDEATSALDPESTSVVLSLYSKRLIKSWVSPLYWLPMKCKWFGKSAIRSWSLMLVKLWNQVKFGRCFLNPQQSITQELLNLEQLDLPFSLKSLNLLQLDTHAIFKTSVTSRCASFPWLKTDFGALCHKLCICIKVRSTPSKNHLIGTLVIAVPTLGLRNSIATTKTKSDMCTHVEVLGYARPTHWFITYRHHRHLNHGRRIRICCLTHWPANGSGILVSTSEHGIYPSKTINHSFRLVGKYYPFCSLLNFDGGLIPLDTLDCRHQLWGLGSSCPFNLGCNPLFWHELQKSVYAK